MWQLIWLTLYALFVEGFPTYLVTTCNLKFYQASMLSVYYLLIFSNALASFNEPVFILA